MEYCCCRDDLSGILTAGEVWDWSDPTVARIGYARTGVLVVFGGQRDSVSSGRGYDVVGDCLLTGPALEWVHLAMSGIGSSPMSSSIVF